MKIASHPANIEAVRKLCQEGKIGERQFRLFEDFEFISNPHLDRDRPNGKYRTLGGQPVAKADFSMKTRFVEYGPEDVDWLVMAGIVVECREMYFYILNDFEFRMRFDMMPMVMHQPMGFLLANTV